MTIRVIQQKADQKVVEENERLILGHVTETSISPLAGSIAVPAGMFSMIKLSKVMFSQETRHRLFFAKPPPNTNIRVATLKMGLELLARCGAVFYGTAAGAAVAGRLAEKSRKIS